MWLLSSTMASSALLGERRYSAAHTRPCNAFLADVTLDFFHLVPRRTPAVSSLLAAACANSGVGRHEQFQFGVGEYRADVAAVHHTPGVYPISLLHGDQFAHLGVALTPGSRSSRPRWCRILHRQVSVDVITRPRSGVEAEGDRNAVEQQFRQLLRRRCPSGWLRGVERHGAVHSARVDNILSGSPRGFWRRCSFARQKENPSAAIMILCLVSDGREYIQRSDNGINSNIPMIRPAT